MDSLHCFFLSLSFHGRDFPTVITTAFLGGKHRAAIGGKHRPAFCGKHRAAIPGKV